MSTFQHNNVDIYIKERSGSRQIRIPWLPDKIEYESGGVKVASYDIMDLGPIEVPTGTGLAKVSWKSMFTGQNQMVTSMQRGPWQQPSYYHQILEDWRKKGTIVNVLVTGYPINKDMYLSDYKATPGGGFGDLEYSVTFTESRSITITSQVVQVVDKNPEPKREEPKTTAYTIKRGDTLWGIAQRFLGAGTKWPTIYNANKTIIESTAKRYGYASSNNGWWIFPGVTIQIPT